MLIVVYFSFVKLCTVFFFFVFFCHVQLSLIGVTWNSMMTNQMELQFLSLLRVCNERYSNSLLALDSTLSSWESKDHRIPWIHT